MSGERTLLRSLVAVAAMVLVAAGCGPAREPAQGAAPGQPASAGGEPLRVKDNGRPEITSQGISRDVVGKVIRVEEIHGTQPGTEWTFEADEYRRIDIRERRPTATGVDLLVFMLTKNNPRPDEEDVQVAGQLRMSYEWKAGKWVLQKIENVSFRYSVGIAT